jgi:hypothetical protein
MLDEQPGRSVIPLPQIGLYRGLDILAENHVGREGYLSHLDPQMAVDWSASLGSALVSLQTSPARRAVARRLCTSA